MAPKSLFYTLFSSLTVALAASVPQTDYEVIVVGGGPAGLTALSGLSRVRRKTALFDSHEYRNAATRNMHDVIGNDGMDRPTPPQIKPLREEFTGAGLTYCEQKAPYPVNSAVWPASRSPGTTPQPSSTRESTQLRLSLMRPRTPHTSGPKTPMARRTPPAKSSWARVS